MFSTFKERLMLGVYIFLLLSIPVGSYLVSQYQTIKSSANEPKSTAPVGKTTPKSTTSPAKELLNTSQKIASQTSPSPNPDGASSPTIANSFGPTLSLKVSLEGRPKTKQSTKLFIGIIEGDLTSSPKFLLSFSVDLPESGEYSNLSLAGLTSGSKYTAILKGSAQIASAVSFSMSPTVSNLNDGQAIILTSGDLNEDNLINSADYSIAQKILGANSKSSNWNGNADLNSDGIINIFDLGLISHNIGKTGDSGAWTSTTPKVASSSASLKDSPSQGGPQGQDGYQQAVTSGYWIWVPKQVPSP